MFLQVNETAGFLQKIKQFDHILFSKINGEWHNSFLDGLFPFTRETFFWLPFYFFLLLFITINFKIKGWLWVMFFAGTIIFSDFVSSVIIKENIMRLRPCNDPMLADKIRFLVKYCPGSSSFTSSHACNHFAAAMFIFTTLKIILGKWRWLIFLWAIIPSYAQVYVGVHFPADIIGGAAAGILIGYLTAYLFNRTVFLNRQT